MSDHNLIDDPLVSFDQQQSIPIKPKINDSLENQLFDDIDPLGSHNGDGGHRNGLSDSKDNGSDQPSLTHDLLSVDQNDTGIKEKKLGNTD